MEAAHVVGLGEGPDQDHVAALLRRLDGVLGREHDLALRRPGRGGHPTRQLGELGVGRERRMQEGIERAGVDRLERFLPREKLLLNRVDGEADRRLGGSLGYAGLEHVEAAVLDRELRVLHVAVVRLQGPEDLHQLRMHVRHGVLHLGDVAWGPDTRHHVLALRVDQVVARGLGGAGDLVAREGDSRARPLAAVPEDHLLHVHRRAPLVGDAVDAPVANGPLAHP